MSYGLNRVCQQKRWLIIFEDRKEHLGKHIPRRYRKTRRLRNTIVYQSMLRIFDYLNSCVLKMK